MQATPEFLAALEDYNDLAERDMDDTPAGHAAWERVIRLAPPEFLDLATAKMRELDMLPAPAGLDADGRPVYALSDLAAKLDVPEQELLDFAEARVDLTAKLVHRGH
jgi:hypothetical protein